LLSSPSSEHSLATALTLLVSLYLAFGPGSNLANIKAAALTLLFTFTYLWVAINR
jgi:putative amide transporter protein